MCGFTFPIMGLPGNFFKLVSGKNWPGLSLTTKFEYKAICEEPGGRVRTSNFYSLVLVLEDALK